MALDVMLAKLCRQVGDGGVVYDFGDLGETVFRNQNPDWTSEMFIIMRYFEV